MDTKELATTLVELVRIRSVNPLGQAANPPSSPQVVDYLEHRLRGHGVSCQRQSVGDREVNLVATLPGCKGAPTVLFDAHTDTVPADDWAARAFSPWIEGTRVYGRGSCDTKAAMAAMLSAIGRVASLPVDRRPNTIMFLASADEEYGRTGIDAFLATCPRIDGAVIGEPTYCAPVVACKGAARWTMVVEGRSAHTSTPRKGINAITRMAGVVRAVEEYETTILAGKHHSLVDPATMTVSLVQGGTAVNVVPAECRLTVDLRTMPPEDPGEAMLDAQKFLSRRLDFPIRHEGVQLWNGADLPPDHALARQCVAACSGAGVPDSAPRGVNYGCHASDCARVGIPAVVVGPGDFGVAHTVNESVDLEAVATAAEIYYRLMTAPLVS